jgi:hypothetical protein
MDQINLYNIVPELKVSKKIALVGNSNILLVKKHGKLIDTFDDVIRFNYGDLNNIYNNITGLKTTIRWVNCPINIESAKAHNKNIKTQQDFNIYTNKLFKNVKIICWQSLQDKLSQINIDTNNPFKFYLPNGLCTLPNINDYLKELGVKNRFNIVENCWPRTGFQAVLTCIKSGIVPHLFGFDISTHSIIKHYSLNTSYYVNNLTQHQVNTEVLILNELKDMNLIIVY